MSSSIEVAIIEPVGGHGGMNYYDFCLAEGLNSAGVRVSLYTCDETAAPESQNFRFLPYFKNIYGEDSKYVRGIRYLRGLLRSFFDAKAKKIAVVHFHFFHAGAVEFFAISLAKIFGFKVVLTVHDVESFSAENTLVRASTVFGKADRVIVHNIVSRDELTRRALVRPDIVQIVPHGNYLGMLGIVPSRDEARSRLKLDSTRKWLLFFGQIKQVKGLDVLLEALAQIKQVFPNIGLVIAGKTWKDDFSVYENKIRSLSLDSHVRADIGYVPDELAAHYYAAADLVVLPYRKIYQSGVLLMAMSYGRAVLASDLPGMTEIIQDGENGLTFSSEDPQSLADAVLRALKSDEKLERVAGAGFEAVRDRHDWGDIGRKTAAVYALLCQP